MESSQEKDIKKIKICAVCGAQATGSVLFVVAKLYFYYFANFFSI